jgi:membrane fusion protein
LFANSKAMGMLQPGQDLLVSYQAFPHEKYGLARGHIVSISSAPLTAVEIAQSLPGTDLQLSQADGPYFMVAVAMDPVWDSSDRPLAYRAGMLIEANIAVERRRIYEWLIEPLASTLRRTSGDTERGPLISGAGR